MRRAKPPVTLQKSGPWKKLSTIMDVDLRPIIDEIASRADDFLAGARDRAQGRAGISELLTIDYPDLDPAQRSTVVTGVMAVLEHEDFFGTEFVGGVFDETDADDD
jgi:hypothetical protein